MVNMAVQWRGPNSSLATLAKELNARFGNPTRLYEYVTGYKSASNVTSHNADNNGIGHAMDIFVGAGHNISVAQGIDLAERLRLEGKKGSIPGHPDRLAYIIHRGRIAGDHTGWEWVKYTGTADHYDHIHISSVFDYYWGDVVAGNPTDYNSTASWDLWAGSTAKPQSGNITPIKEEDEMTPAQMLELKQFIQEDNEARHLATRKDVKEHGFSYGNKLFIQGVVEDKAVVTRDVVRAAVATLATHTPGIDTGKLEAALEEAVAKAVKEGLANGIDIDVTVGGAK